jgi:uncharacterized protein (DUF1499 family)
MPSDRAYDVAVTEAAFRVANERMVRWEERHADGVDEMYLCECAEQPCRQRVRLSRDEYEAVRSDARRFVVVPGHVIPELETVVQSFQGYEVIEKPSALHDLLAETDPRTEHSGRATHTAETLADELRL